MKEILITSSVLIVALLLLRLIFGRKVSRGLIYAAWALVALRLLLPVQIGQMHFSVLTAAKPLTQTVAEASELRIIGQNQRDAEISVTQSYIEQDRSVFTPEVLEYIEKSIASGSSAEELATALVKTQGSTLYVPQMQEQVAQQVQAQTKFVSLGQVARVVWLCGAGVMALWFGLVNARHGYILRKNRKRLETVGGLPVYVSETVETPCLAGFFRPVIYLTPESAADGTVRHHVLTHELTHYRHGDHIWALVRCVCLCIYWFDPLVWVAAFFSRRDCELACDAGAIKRLGEQERLAYGKSLVDVVSQAGRPARLLHTATSMNETKEQLKERVNFIVKKPKISLICVMCMVLVCALVAGCAMTGATRETAESGKAWEISEQEQLRIRQEYIRFWNLNCDPEEIRLVTVSPVGDGYALFIGTFDDRATWDALMGTNVAGFDFYMPANWQLDFFSGTEFCTLSEAYNLGWVSKEQVQSIWEHYCQQFPAALEYWQEAKSHELTAAEQSEITALLKYDIWYRQALLFIFDDPTEIDMQILFYNGTGVPSLWSDVTVGEKAFLLDNGFDTSRDIQIRSAEAMELILQQYFGADLQDVSIPEEWLYSETANTWYSNDSGELLPEGLKIRSLWKRDANTFEITYYTDSEVYNPDFDMSVKTERVLCLERQADGTYRILSNTFVI